MILYKECKICGKEFGYPHWRKMVLYCSPECRQVGITAKPNVCCTNCGSEFHLKKSQRERYERHMGTFCSRKCMYEYKKKWFRGENNHQYGLKGDKNDSFKGEEIEKANHRLMEIRVYSPGHPMADCAGRVLKHHLVVEENHLMFDPKYFEEANGRHILKRGFVLHHKDGNHSNNDVANLEIMTRGEHASYHNRLNRIPRDNKSGRFIKRTNLESCKSYRGTGGYGSTGE